MTSPHTEAVIERWLLEDQLVTPLEMAQVREYQESNGTTLSTALLEEGLLTEAQWVEMLARRYRLPKAPQRLHRMPVPARALSAIPQDLCWQYHLFPFGVDVAASRLQVAVVDPGDNEAQEMLDGLGELEAEVFVVGPKSLEKAIRKHYMDAWVDDSRGGKRPFFGYDDITNPGVAAHRRAPSMSAPRATPAVPPAPKVMKEPSSPGLQRLVRDPESHPAVRQTEQHPVVSEYPPVYQLPQPAPVVETTPPPEAVEPVPAGAVGRLKQPVSRGQLDRRLQRVERALSSLCATLLVDADAQVRQDLERVLSYLAEDES